MTRFAYRRALRQAIADHYSLDELKILVFDLGLDWDELAGDAKTPKIVSLIEWLERNGRLPDLIELLQKDRPHFSWPVLSLTPPPGQNLSGVKLKDIDWRRAELYSADLSGADLRGADLRGAKMRKVNLSRADLTDARLGGADLRLANLTGAKITLTQLASVRKLKGAILPDGTRSPG